MEGTLEQKMDEFANTLGADYKEEANLKEEVVEVKNTDVLQIGQVYKITGGKWKKYKKAKVIKINKTYSDVYIWNSKDDKPHSYSGESEHFVPVPQKCKNCYLHPCDEIIEMPDANNLEIVDNSVDINKLYDEAHPPADDVVEDDVVDDITDALPSIEEALALKEENARLKEEIVSLLKKIKAIKNVCDI